MRTFPLALAALLLAACGGSLPPPRDISAEVVDEALVCTAETGGAEQSIGQLNQDTEIFLLDGGVTALLKQTPGNPVVAVRLYIDGGSRLEDPSQSGITSFALDVATSGGTSELGKAALAARLAAMGSGLGFRVDFDFSTMSMSSLDVFFEDTWTLFRQVFDSAVFPEDEIAVSRERHLHAIRARVEDPDARVVDTARELLFAGHPYANDPVGTEEAVTALSRDDLVGHYSSLFDGSRMLLVVVGDIDRDRLEAVVGDTFSSTPASRTRPDRPAPFVVTAPDVLVEAAPVPTNYIIGLAPAPSPEADDYPALQLALSHLSDRFFEEVRTARNLSYAVAAGLSSRMANYSYIYVTTVDPAAALAVMETEIEALRTTPLSDTDVEQLIAGFITSYYQGFDSNGAIASELAWWTLYGGGPQNADTFVQQIHAVTPADIRRAASEWLGNYQFGVVGDPAAIDREGIISTFAMSGT